MNAARMDTRARFNNSTRLMGHRREGGSGGGGLLVHESDKKELITYPARSPRYPRVVDEEYSSGWVKEYRREGWASAVNCQIFILKGADRSTSNIHRFLKLPLPSYSAKLYSRIII